MSGRPITISALLIIMVALVLLTVFSIEAFYIAGYRQTLTATAQAMMNAKIDQLYTDTHDLWHGLTLISSTISRSEEMREFVLSDRHDEQALKGLRRAVNLSQLVSDEVISVMVTDLGALELFSYSEEDRAVLAHLRNAISQGLVIKSPVHLMMGHGAEATTYCVNRTDPGADGIPLYTVLIYDLKLLRQAFASMADASMSILLLDGNDNVVMQSRAHSDEEIAQILRIAKDSAGERRDIMQVRRLSLLRWQLVAMLDSSAQARQMEPVWRFALWTDVFITAGLFIFYLVLRAQIDTPVRQMLSYMQRVAAGEAHARLDLGMRNELSAIQDGLNDMLTQLMEMTSENERAQKWVYELRLSHKQAEIATLASQINPHFLFNTLDCMRGIAASGGGDQLEIAIDALAAIFRHATRAAPMVPLYEEMRIIEHYMAIVHIRHVGRITMESRIDPDAGNCLIPKMMLQPLVENAVIHGMEAVSREGLLVIEAKVSGDMLLITVEDNGCGMRSEALEALSERLAHSENKLADAGSHIGLLNIHRRLRLLYGPPSGLALEARENGGIRVIVRSMAQRKQ